MALLTVLRFADSSYGALITILQYMYITENIYFGLLLYGHSKSLASDSGS
jgi:hypothetical protein